MQTATNGILPSGHFEELEDLTATFTTNICAMDNGSMAIYQPDCDRKEHCNIVLDTQVVLSMAIQRGNFIDKGFCSTMTRFPACIKAGEAQQEPHTCIQLITFIPSEIGVS